MIYLDSAATSEPHELIREFVLYRNPSSRTHVPGLETKKLVEEARQRLLGIIPGARQVVFTSGATESLMLLIRGLEETRKRRWVISPIEHKAALNQVLDVSTNVKYFSVSDQGEIIFDPGLVKNSVCVSMLVNNETGIINRSLKEIKESGAALTICDATQAIGKVQFDLHEDGIDFLVGSSHKFHGPMGCGFIAIRDEDLWDEIRSISVGGNQERAIRSGTLNSPSIINTGIVCNWLKSNQINYVQHLNNLKSHFEDKLTQLTSCDIIGKDVERAPHISSIYLPGVDNEALISSVKSELAISSGSACTSYSVEPSHVLQILLESDEKAECVIRVSYGFYNTIKEVELAANIIATSAQTIRSFA